MDMNLTKFFFFAGAAAVAALSGVSALATQHNVAKPNVQLSCQPGKLTLINRSEQPLRIQQRSGRFFKLQPAYQAGMPLNNQKNSLKLITLRDRQNQQWQGFTVNTSQKGAKWGKFNCRIPKDCLSSVKSGTSAGTTTRNVECVTPGEKF